MLQIIFSDISHFERYLYHTVFLLNALSVIHLLSTLYLLASCLLSTHLTFSPTTLTLIFHFVLFCFLQSILSPFLSPFLPFLLSPFLSPFLPFLLSPFLPFLLSPLLPFLLSPFLSPFLPFFLPFLLYLFSLLFSYFISPHPFFSRTSLTIFSSAGLGTLNRPLNSTPPILA